jgi:spermidine synthase
MAEQAQDNHPLGVLVARTEDDQGAVCVRQAGHHRFLTFDNAVEQSCFNTARPYRLEHAYTQAMMLGLLLVPASDSAVVLGLGGGSLVRALRHARPDMDIAAIESRRAVLDAARLWFGIDEHDPSHQLVCQDAEEFLAERRGSFDLVFADLYHAEGASPLHNAPAFLDRCRAHLSAQGVLLLNHWCSEFRDSLLAREALQQVFGDSLLYLHVQGGNVIAFAFADQLPDLDRKRFIDDALALGRTLDIPLHRLARNFWRQNSEPLKLGRFGRR